jgi:preprotein translocase subunit SecF
MEFFKIRRDIPFMRHALVFNAVSLITFLAAVFFLFSRGLHLSVEFTGGTLMEVSYSQPADLASIRESISKLGFADVQVQNFGTAQDVLIRMPVQKGSTASASWLNSSRPMPRRTCAGWSLWAPRSATSWQPTG